MRWTGVTPTAILLLKSHWRRMVNADLNATHLGIDLMRTVILLLLAVFFFSDKVLADESLADEPQGAALNGIWFCDTVNGYEAYRARRSVLIVRDREFVMVTGTGVTKSTFTTDQRHIDIQRFDGLSQPGIFRLDRSTLHLSLGDADGVRPTHYGHLRGKPQKSQPPHSHYLFTRTPTPEGLEILRDALNDEHKRNTILAESIVSATR